MKRAFFFRPGARMALTAFLFVSALIPGKAFASCGLQFCPRPADHGGEAGWEAGLRTRWVAFDADGASGSYFTAAPRVLWRPGAFAFSADVPFTRLEAGGEIRTGLSNPLLAALYHRRLSAAWSGEAGLQLELPLGDSEKGLADDHTMALPWIGLRRDFGASWRASGLFGYSLALESGRGHAAPAPLAKIAHEGHDHGAEAPPRVLVNPHGDREAHWRAGLARALGRSVVEGFALGQVDLSDGAARSTWYARAGLSWDYALTRAFGLQITVDAPVTAARRSDAEVGMGVKAGW